MKKIIKRISLILINILLVFSNNISVFGNNSNVINNYFDKWDWRYLLKSDLYAYKLLSADIKSCFFTQKAFYLSDMVKNSGTSPSKQKYQEVLTNIIFTYDFNTSEKISEQYKLDKLKSGKDYLIDAKDMIVDAVSIYSWGKKDNGKMEEVLTTVIDSLSVLIDNSDNYLETISNLETILYNYGKYDEFLSYIYENSQGELKEAAKELNSKFTSLMKIKLDMYTDVTDKNFQNFSETFMSDIFIETIKQTNDYANDECLQTITGVGEKILDIDELYKSVEDLMFITAKTVGNITVGGENLINRAFEIEALSDIEEIVSKMIFEQQNELLENQSLKNLEKYVYNCKILSCIHIRGEYCVSNISKDAGAWAKLGFTNIKEDEEWYKSRAKRILSHYNNLDNLLYDFKEEQATEETTENYEWYLEPTIQADNIIVPDYESELFEKYAIIEKDGKYGLISNTGELIEDIKYNDFLICPLNIYVIGNGDVSDFDLNSKENIGYKIEDEKLIKINHGGHGIGDVTYYYYNVNDSKTYAVTQIGDNYKEYKEDNVVLAQSASISIKEDGTYSCNNIYDDFYLVNKNGKITNAIYENGNNYYFNLPNNIIYAKQNNEWYYFNNKGEQIIFDNIKSNYMENGHIKTNKSNKNNITNYPFLDVENVIAINTGNNGIFYDIKGNRLTNSKEFEEVRPMINGYAWVKKDGKWGVINFHDFNSIENYENLKQKYHKQTELKEEEKEAWKMEYIEYIKGIAQKDSYIYDNGKFVFVNINGDDIPEIFYDSGSGYGGSGLITYSNEKVVELHMGNSSYINYIEGKNIFKYSGGHMDVYYDKIYSIDNGDFVLHYTGDYGASDNSNIQFDSDGNLIYNYYWNNVKVSKEEYNNLINETYDSQSGININELKGSNYNDFLNIIENYSNNKYESDKQSNNANKNNKGTVKIEDGYLNVRDTPSTKGKIIGKLNNSDKVTIKETSEDGKWYKISKDNINGYVSKDYVKID